MLTDELWIIVMFLSDSHSDGTHSLQSIHCWDTDAETHFSKSDEETNSSTSRMAWKWARSHFWQNFSFNAVYTRNNYYVRRYAMLNGKYVK